MASIGGLSGTTSNSINSMRGFGGLASGLDRDSLIESMTYATRSKIDQFQGKKTKLQWKQDAIRNISDKMIAFAEKYTATLASTSNLFSGALWGRSQITALGANSKYISTTGYANSASTISIAGIKNLAEKAKWSSANTVSDGTLESGAIDMASETVENLNGKTLTFRYDGADYTVSLADGKYEDGTAYKFDTIENTQKALEDALARQNDGKLKDVVNVNLAGDKIEFRANTANLEDPDDPSKMKELQLTGGTALEYLGFKENAEDEFTAVDMTNGNPVAPAHDVKLTSELSFFDKVAGKAISFRYNGSLQTFHIPGADELKDTDGNNLTGQALMEKIQGSLQTQMDAAYGKDRIKVGLTPDNTNGSYKLDFKTMKPGGDADTSSTLTLVSADSGLADALKLKSGDTNRLNLNTTLNQAGFKGLKDSPISGVTSFTLNGEKIDITEEDSVYTLMDKINKSGADVTVSYQDVGDKFVFTSKQDGASGRIQFGGDAAALDTVKAIFGADIPTNEIRGKDAVIAVKYGDSDEVVELTRGTNTFSLDGMTVNLKGTFGYNGDTVDKTAEAVTFNAEVDTTKIMDTVKKMVEEYNEILELVNKESRTRPARDYHPLTSAEKKELEKDEIELYENKAKEGILYGDTDIRSLVNDLRFAINPADLAEMEKIGLTVSGTYSDNGKLVLDETKFKAALDADPEKVQQLFTKTDGIASNLKNVMNKYVNTLGEKGILINKAGSTKAPRSIMENGIYKEMGDMDKKIAQFQGRLKVEQDRYIKQFTSLESLISQMNAQSGWLSQFGGY